MKKYLHQLVAKEKKSYVKVSSCVMIRPDCLQALFSQIQGYLLHSGKKVLIILRVLFLKQNEEKNIMN
jgi:hypothetical protein